MDAGWLLDDEKTGNGTFAAKRPEFDVLEPALKSAATCY